MGATLAGGRPTATGTVRDDDGLPGMPRDLTARAGSTSSIELSWREPGIGAIRPSSATTSIGRKTERRIGAYSTGNSSPPCRPLPTPVPATPRCSPGRHVSTASRPSTRPAPALFRDGRGCHGIARRPGRPWRRRRWWRRWRRRWRRGREHPPVVEREIPDRTLEAGSVLELDITLNFYDRNQRALDYYVESDNPAVATVTVNRQASDDPRDCAGCCSGHRGRRRPARRTGCGHLPGAGIRPIDGAVVPTGRGPGAPGFRPRDQS